MKETSEKQDSPNVFLVCYLSVLSSKTYVYRCLSFPKRRGLVVICADIYFYTFMFLTLKLTQSSKKMGEYQTTFLESGTAIL